jgi:site-specific recombinase XerD
MRDSNSVSAGLVAAWVVWLAGANLSENTLKIRRMLALVYCDHLDPLTSTPAQLSHFLATRPGHSWSKSGYLSTLRGFHRWLYLNGHRDDDPTISLPAIRTPRPVPHPCPEDVLARALEDAGDEVRLMLLLGAYAGLRRSEIAKVHAGDVRGDMLTVTGKGNVTRRIPIHPRLEEPLAAVTGWAFPSHRNLGERLSSHTVGQRMKDALGGGWTAHSCRHAFATRVYAATRDLRAVQALLGHASPATTSGYVGIDDRAMRAAIHAVA